MMRYLRCSSCILTMYASMADICFGASLPSGVFEVARATTAVSLPMAKLVGGFSVIRDAVAASVTSDSKKDGMKVNEEAKSEPQ